MMSLQKFSPKIPHLEVEPLWQLTKGDPRIVIALLDGPVNLDHPNLKGASLQLIPLANKQDTQCQSHQASACSHGTQVASLIFGQHEQGHLFGIAPRCKGLIIPIFHDASSNFGQITPASQSILAQAIDLARVNGAHIINISAGERSTNGQPSALLASAIKRCVEAGVLIISAAGNDGCNCLHIPAAMPEVLTVGALNTAGKPAQFSNFGNLYRQNGLLAPGENLTVALSGGGYAKQSGTSFAAPLVAGVVGLFLSLGLIKNIKVNTLDIRKLLLQSAQPCLQANPDKCLRYLAGVLDCRSALNHFFSGASLMTDSNTTITSEAPSSEILPAGLDLISNKIKIPYRSESWQDDSLVHHLQPSFNTQRYEAATPAQSYQAQNLPNQQGQISPSSAGGDCSCQKNAAAEDRVQLVYALGTISYDFGTQARFDAIAADIGSGANIGTLLTPAVGTSDLLDYLTEKPYAASSIIWTLNLDAMPLYAIRADGPFAMHIFDRLRQFLSDQVNPDQRAERVSIPGYIDGSIRLSSGQNIPVLVPEIRGMYNWTTKAFIEACVGKPEDSEKYRNKMDGMTNFLDRVYYEIRNLGVEHSDRALNFAATNAFQIERIFERAVNNSMQLDQIEVTRSPICRTDSDCWDVVLYFFNPKKMLEEARRAYRFTVDVSDIVPVLIGEIREWSVR